MCWSPSQANLIIPPPVARQGLPAAWGRSSRRVGRVPFRWQEAYPGRRPARGRRARRGRAPQGLKARR
eukprot:2782632-Pyramimonas_sp.AAC.1